MIKAPGNNGKPTRKCFKWCGKKYCECNPPKPINLSESLDMHCKTCNIIIVVGVNHSKDSDYCVHCCPN